MASSFYVVLQLGFESRLHKPCTVREQVWGGTASRVMPRWLPRSEGKLTKVFAHKEKPQSQKPVQNFGDFFSLSSLSHLKRQVYSVGHKHEQTHSRHPRSCTGLAQCHVTHGASLRDEHRRHWFAHRAWPQQEGSLPATMKNGCLSPKLKGRQPAPL